MNSLSDWDTAIDGWLAGTLSDTEAQAFQLELQTNRDLQKALIRASHLDNEIGKAVSAREERRALGFVSDRMPAIRTTQRSARDTAKRTSAPNSRGRLPIRHSRAPARSPSSWPMALAAVCMLAIGALVIRSQLAAPVPAVLGTLTAANGTIEFRTGTLATPGHVGDIIAAGMYIHVGSSSSAFITSTDGSELTIRADTVCEAIATERGTQFYVPLGRVSASVTKQQAGQTYTIITPHADITVIGTKFDIDVNSRQTALHVTEGRVQFTDRFNNERHLVAAGGQVSTQESALTASTPTLVIRTPNAHRPEIGIELTTASERSPQPPFIDVFRTTSPWVSSSKDPVATDRQGWITNLAPDQIVTTTMCRELNGHYPGGRYTCRYDGEGTLAIAGDARLLSHLSHQPGRCEIEVIPRNDGIQLSILTTNPANPIRNIQVFRPGGETTATQQPFAPEFLNDRRGAAVVHAADWAEYRSGDQPYTWADRLTPEHGPLDRNRGRPLEDTLDLAAALNADVWIRLPYQADDSYVQGAAYLTQQKLARGQRVYLELGRDLWDAAWEPGIYAQAQGEALQLDQPAGLHWAAQRSVEVFNQWKTIFGDDPRLVRVLSCSATKYHLTTMLNWKNTRDHIDAVSINASIGAVFGDGQDPNSLFNLTANDIGTALRKSVTSLPERLQAVQKEIGTLRLIGIRGGPLFAPSEKTTRPLTWQHRVAVAQLVNSSANRSDIRTVLAEQLSVWTRTTNDLVVVTLSDGGLRSADDEDTPLGQVPSLAPSPTFQAIAPNLRRQAAAQLAQ